MSRRATPGKNPNIHLDKRATMPLYRQLYEGLRAGILTGQLESGARLPSTRVLAEELGVSRNTIAQAYELLQSEGYIESTVGSGTRIPSLKRRLLNRNTRNAPNQEKTGDLKRPLGKFRERGQISDVIRRVNFQWFGTSFSQPILRGLPSSVGHLDARLEHLTERELEVLRRLGRGCSNKEIGDQLSISVNTVKTHVAKILGKLSFTDRTQAALFAVKRGLA